MYPSRPDSAPYSTWDYNKHKDSRYTSGLGRQISIAAPVDAMRRTGLPSQAYHRFTTIQNRLTVAPRAYAMQSALMSAAESRAQILGRS